MNQISITLEIGLVHVSWIAEKTPVLSLLWFVTDFPVPLVYSCCLLPFSILEMVMNISLEALFYVLVHSVNYTLFLTLFKDVFS